MSDSDSEYSEEIDLNDADLERIFEQLKGRSNVELDQETQRAMAALQMIDRLRELESDQETARNQFQTLADELDIDPSSLPESIGRFQIKGLVGKGGFGMVFQASDPLLDRMVALKIPRPEALMTSELRQRFVREGKAAAALAHPNIVPVFESGTASSVCFLASELVDGETLEAWAATQPGVPLEKVVTIGKVLSEAIAHAHQRGVIHRDIKPGNILVDNRSELDLHRRIKVTDFGLAKQLHQDDGQTQTGALIGTPSFMATEQALQQTSTTSSDIYSIGAVIYWLLTGVPPFRGESIIETIQAITQEEPVAPRTIKSSIPRDLESICLRCLEKDPRKRYESASDLYSDLDRFENGQPVEARAITPTIRFLRWVGRNQLVSSLLVLLLAGVITSTVGLVRAKNAEARANESTESALAAESEARTEQELAIEVAEYLVSIFKIPRNNPKKASEVTALEILNRSSSKIRDDLDNQPEVRLRLMQTMAEAYKNMGLYADSIGLYREVLADAEKLGEPEFLDWPQLHVDFGYALRKNEEWMEAEKELLTAEELFEEDRESNLVALANVNNELALIASRSDLTRAIAFLRKARALTLENEPDSKAVWQLDQNIASMSYRNQNYQGALVSFQEALKGGIDLLGDSHPRLGPIYSNIAATLRKLGKAKESIAFSEKSLAVTKANLPNAHPDVGLEYFGLANGYRSIGQLQLALENEQKGLEILKLLPANHTLLRVNKSNHSVTLLLMRDYDKAIAVLNDLVSDEQNESNKLEYTVRLAQIDSCQGEFKKAEERLQGLLDHDFTGLPNSSYTNVLVELAIVKAKTDRKNAKRNMDVVLAKCIETNSPLDKNAFFLARFWAVMGDKEACLEKLEEAVDLGLRSHQILKPEFDQFRTDPEFVKVEKFMLDQ